MADNPAMTINEKIEKFMASCLTPTTTVFLDQLSSLGVEKSLSRSISNLLFERGVCVRAEVNAMACSSFFGAESYMNAGGYIRERVFVGRYCSIGRRVTLGAGMHNMRGVSTHPGLHGSRARRYSEAELSRLAWGGGTKVATPTIIGNDVWIGDGAVILPGVTVGTGAVIGANAVVTRNVAPYEIVGGVPAKRLKMRFPDEVGQELLCTEYWEWPLETLKGLPMRNVFEFISRMRQLDHSHQCSFETFAVSSA
jgi:acetyltransferase-like isoleucine patch superfamily enzyme